MIATVAPMFSSMPPLLFTQPLCSVVEMIPPAKELTRFSASLQSDTRTAGGQERQKPFTFAHGFLVYLFNAYTVCFARASSSASSVCVTPISSVGHIAAKLLTGYSPLHQGLRRRYDASSKCGTARQHEVAGVACYPPKKKTLSLSHQCTPISVLEYNQKNKVSGESRHWPHDWGDVAAVYWVDPFVVPILCLYEISSTAIEFRTPRTLVECQICRGVRRPAKS